MAHPYLPDSNQKQKSISQTGSILVSTILSTLFPLLGMSFLVQFFSQLPPIKIQFKSFTFLKPSQTTILFHPFLKSTGILILNNHFGIFWHYYEFLCLYINLSHVVLCSLGFTFFNDSFCPPQHFAQCLCSVFAQQSNIC